MDKPKKLKKALAKKLKTGEGKIAPVKTRYQVGARNKDGTPLYIGKAAGKAAGKVATQGYIGGIALGKAAKKASEKMNKIKNK
jgi:hypothetical protein